MAGIVEVGIAGEGGNVGEGGPAVAPGVVTWAALGLLGFFLPSFGVVSGTVGISWSLVFVKLLLKSVDN